MVPRVSRPCVWQGRFFCLLGNIDFLVYKNAPRGNTLVRKEVTKVTRTRRGCFSEEKHFVHIIHPLAILIILLLGRCGHRPLRLFSIIFFVEFFSKF